MVASARFRSARRLVVAAAFLVSAVAVAAGPARPAHAAGPVAYVANVAGGSVSVVDTTTNTVTATIPVGDNPTGVVANPAGTRVYVTNETSDSVSVIATATGTVVATIPVGARPAGIAVTPDGRQVVVGNTGDGTLSFINTGTNAVTATAYAGVDPYGLAISPDGTLVYVTGGVYNPGIQVVKVRTHRWFAAVSTGNFRYASVVFDPSGGTAYAGAAGGGDNYFSVIDVATSTVRQYLVIRHAAPYLSALAINPADTRLWLTEDSVSAVCAQDLTTYLAAGCLHLGTDPDGIAFTPDGSAVYVTDFAANTVSVIDPTSYAVTATLTGFQAPEGIAMVG